MTKAWPLPDSAMNVMWSTHFTLDFIAIFVSLGEAATGSFDKVEALP